MQAIRGRDTSAELSVRRLIHAEGLRYRVDAAPLVGVRRRADIVFRRQKIAVFIDGCFWHGCPEHGRKSFNSNPDYWPSKIESNRARDMETTALLSEAGWTVMRFWEHEESVEVARTIERVVRSSE